MDSADKIEEKGSLISFSWFKSNLWRLRKKSGGATFLERKHDPWGYYSRDLKPQPYGSFEESTCGLPPSCMRIRRKIIVEPDTYLISLAYIVLQALFPKASREKIWSTVKPRTKSAEITSNFLKIFVNIFSTIL